MTNNTLTPQEWEQRYQTDNTPWIHHGLVAPLLTKAQELLPVSSSILDVGCGHGAEALALADMGHDVLGIDVAPSAITLAQTKRSPHLKLDFKTADLLAMAASKPEFNAIVEVCVLHAQRSDPERERFINALNQQLQPGGLWFHVSCRKPELVAVAEAYQVDPPPGLREECVKELVSNQFDVIHEENIDYSIKRSNHPLVPFPARFVVLKKH